MSDSEEDLHFPEEIQPVRRQRGLRWLAILWGFLLFLVFCPTLLLTYWFPSELVRPELEAQLSELLEGVVRIRSLSFNLLTGLELTDVEFTRQQEPLVKLGGLTLDYSLWELLQQRLRVKEDRIEGVTVSLNLPGIQVVPAPPRVLCVQGVNLYRKVLSSSMTGLVS